MSNHSSKEQANDQHKAAIISKAVCKAADFWEISNQQLGEILGLSSSTVSRLRRHQFFLSMHTKEWEIALLFLRAFRGLDAYLGGHVQNEIAWLNATNSALGGTPLKLIQGVEGLASVVQYIDCVRGR